MGVAKAEPFLPTRRGGARRATISSTQISRICPRCRWEAEIAQTGLAPPAIAGLLWQCTHWGVAPAEGMDWLCDKLRENKTVQQYSHPHPTLPLFTPSHFDCIMLTLFMD
jgi:hypothetical protein